MSSVEAIERIAERGDDVLQRVVDVLHDEVEHDRPTAFGEGDRAFLQRVAVVIGRFCN